MTDEIKRVVEDILNRSLPFAWTMYEKYGIEKLEKEFSKSLLSERRKAYEECLRILQIKLWREIANEIRRRMEGV